MGEGLHDEAILCSPIDSFASDGSYGGLDRYRHLLFTGMRAMGWYPCGYLGDHVGTADGDVFPSRLSRCALRGAWQWGDVSPQWPCMVSFL